ncbi:DUF2514 family protein [Enterobacter roggenkampii]|uniref:DUF2514 family protein n=1 Tax=Enterobacter roggenkampii TaxID=1812935 RepID=UPI002DBC80DB|nr:DUF2514 family protein [Enterobacter roggenkampii]MEB5890010.1 DUF2514 domain-containing protein [Enterobacter roggenkampii]
MIGILNFLYALRHILAFAAVMMLIAGLIYGGYTSGQQTADQEWRLKWSIRDRKEAEDSARYQQTIRQLEQQRAIALREVTENAQNKITLAYADAARAQSAAERLQHTIRSIRRQLADSETGRLAAAAGQRQSTTATAVLLTNVFSRADKRAGELAAYADRTRIAGETCEKLYRNMAAGGGDISP